MAERGRSKGLPWDVEAPLEVLPGIGPKTAARLADAGFESIRDLLFHLPRRYENRGAPSAIAEVVQEGSHTIIGRVSGVQRVFTRRRGLRMIRARVNDESGAMKVVWFNQPYLKDQLDAEKTYRLHGSVRLTKDDSPELVNPSWEDAAAETPDIVPVYPAIAGFGQGRLRRLLATLVSEMDLDTALDDPLPSELVAERGLVPLAEAIRGLHAPPPGTDTKALEQRESAGHRRLVYGELLELRTRIELTRSVIGPERKLHSYLDEPEVRQALREVLPFELTSAQLRVVAEILTDLRRPEPMHRLLQGDVGCGKTIVAVMAIVTAIESGLQAALMAPTEILAEQHAFQLQALLGNRYRCALYTGSRDTDLGELERGEIDLAIGTHALIQKATRFRRLGLVVIDEQHRFGVAQRRRLVEKGALPDLLVMTATPIPRSLALTTYGDLDLSVVDELPPGRGTVETRVLAKERRREVYDALARQVRDGAQAFVVLPFIEANEALDVSALEREGREVITWLEGCRSAFVHGRVHRDERERVMDAFRRGDLDVLVSTSVIEVGVDVPAARFMVIESAERFGLAQLHQLRGRIGRGAGDSYCLALHGRLTAGAKVRLEVFRGSRDGFVLAEADLEQRGPGELEGARQWGWPSLRCARLPHDLPWLEMARDDAKTAVGPPLPPAWRRWVERVAAEPRTGSAWVSRGG